MAENSLDVIARFDRRCRFLYVNPIVSQHAELPHQAFLGKSLEEVGVPPDVRRVMQSEIDAVFATGHTRRTELRWPNGSWIDLMLVAERGDNDEPRAVISSARDITALKRTEEELRRREARLEEAQSLANVGDFVWDTRTRQITWSKQLCRIHGLPVGAVIFEEVDYWNLIVPTDREVVARHITAGQTTGEPRGFEYRIVRPDGVVRSLAASICAKRDDTGAIISLSGSVQDVTNQVLASHELRKSEELYRMIADNVGDGIWMIALSTMRLIYASPTVVERLGYSQEELAQVSIEQLLTPESFARMQSVLAEALPLAKPDRNIVRRLEVEERMKSGATRWVEVTARPLFDTQGVPREIVGVTHDISERRRAHELLTKAKAHAEDVSRLKWIYRCQA